MKYLLLNAGPYHATEDLDLSYPVLVEGGSTPNYVTVSADELVSLSDKEAPRYSYYNIHLSFLSGNEIVEAIGTKVMVELLDSDTFCGMDSIKFPVQVPATIKTPDGRLGFYLDHTNVGFEVIGQDLMNISGCKSWAFSPDQTYQFNPKSINIVSIIGDGEKDSEKDSDKDGSKDSDCVKIKEVKQSATEQCKTEGAPVKQKQRSFVIGDKVIIRKDVTKFSRGSTPDIREAQNNGAVLVVKSLGNESGKAWSARSIDPQYPWSWSYWFDENELKLIDETEEKDQDQHQLGEDTVDSVDTDKVAIKLLNSSGFVGMEDVSFPVIVLATIKERSSDVVAEVSNKELTGIPSINKKAFGIPDNNDSNDRKFKRTWHFYDFELVETQSEEKHGLSATTSDVTTSTASTVAPVASVKQKEVLPMKFSDKLGSAILYYTADLGEEQQTYHISKLLKVVVNTDKKAVEITREYNKKGLIIHETSFVPFIEFEKLVSKHGDISKGVDLVITLLNKDNDVYLKSQESRICKEVEFEYSII